MSINTTHSDSCKCPSAPGVNGNAVHVEISPLYALKPHEIIGFPISVKQEARPDPQPCDERRGDAIRHQGEQGSMGERMKCPSSSRRSENSFSSRVRVLQVPCNGPLVALVTASWLRSGSGEKPQIPRVRRSTMNPLTLGCAYPCNCSMILTQAMNDDHVALRSQSCDAISIHHGLGACCDILDGQRKDGSS